MYLARMWIYTYLIFIGIFRDGSAVPDLRQLAKEGQFKYMAFIKGSAGLRCSGAILDNYHILTAASCVAHIHPKILFTVIVGSVKLPSESSISRDVRTIHIHPDFLKWRGKEYAGFFTEPIREKHIDNNIAVLTLKKSLPLGKNIISLSLPCDPSIPHHIPLDFCVWRASEAAEDEVHLRYTKMAIHNPPCYDTLMPALEDVFYAVNLRNGQSPASYEKIGSPLVIGDIVYGIFVYENFHQKLNTYVTTFLKVHYYRNFIENAMADTSLDNNNCDCPKLSGE